MKLTAFERRVLGVIWKSCPVSFEDDSQGLSGASSPPVSHESLVERFGEYRRQKLDESIHALIKYQQIEEVFLAKSGPESTKEATGGAEWDSEKSDPALRKHSSGSYGYQVTRGGKASLESRRSKVQSYADWIWKPFVPINGAEIVRLIIVLAVGIVLGLVFSGEFWNWMPKQ